MENDKRYRTLGREKIKDVKKDGESLYEKYVKKADDLGHGGPIRMKKEHGMLIFYVLIGD